MSQVSRAASKLKFETGDRPTQSDFTDLHDSVTWYDDSLTSRIPAQDDQRLTEMAALGSTIKAQPVGYSIANVSSNVNPTDNTLYLVAVYLRTVATITGAKWFQQTQGSYTSDNYNGIGLYSYSGGVLTLVASSADDGNIWKAAANQFVSKAFSSPYPAQAGVYFIGFIYNNSAQVTSPQFGTMGSVGNLFFTAADFTNSAKLHSSLAAQNSLPSSLNMSATTGYPGKWYFALY